MDRSVKLLLTLLVLLGGLSVAPAQAGASLGGRSSVEQVEAGRSDAAAVVAARSFGNRRAARLARMSVEPDQRGTAGLVRIPAIRFGDRALE